MRTPPQGLSGGASNGATKRHGWGKRMRTPPLGPSVELPMGPRNASLGGGPACEHRQWGLRWGSLVMGQVNAVLGGGSAGEHRGWGLRWSSLWRRGTLCW
eukprot:7573944-Pyramimonas_sp.AAC.1